MPHAICTRLSKPRRLRHGPCQHLRAEAGEKAGRYRPGDDARQIQHPHAEQRSRGEHRPDARGRSGALSPGDQRLFAHRLALRMLPPRLFATHRCGAAACVDHRLLKRVSLPARHLPRQRVAVRMLAQYALHCRAMRRRVGVQADPAVGAAIVAGKGVPQRGRRAIAGKEAGLKPARGEAYIDAHRLAGADKIRRRLGCQPDAGGRQLADGESG